MRGGAAPHVVVIQERLAFRFGKVPDKRGIALRVGKELPALPDSLPVVFKKHRRHLERAQVTGVFRTDYGRTRNRLRRKQRRGYKSRKGVCA